MKVYTDFPAYQETEFEENKLAEINYQNLKEKFRYKIM